MIALPRGRAPRVALPNSPLQLVAGGLTVAALVELAILRTFTRTAIHIPALEELSGPYTVLSDFGRFAYYLSVLLLICALPLVAAVLWRGGRVTGRAGAVAIGGFALVAFLAAGDGLPDYAGDALTVVTVVALAGIAAGKQRAGGALALLLFAASFALSGAHTTVQAAAQAGLGTLDGERLLQGAEWTGIAFAATAPLLAPVGGSRRTLIAAGVIAAVVFASLLGNGGATTRILLLWNEGLSGTLPSFVYAAGAGALAFAALRLLGARQGMAAAGFLLVLAGGIGLHNTYQSGLVIAGLALLALAPPASQAAAFPGREAQMQAEPQPESAGGTQ